MREMNIDPREASVLQIENEKTLTDQTMSQP